jgi:hypothetical protein
MITKNDEDYFMVGDDEVTKEVKDYMPPVYHSAVPLFTTETWSEIAVFLFPVTEYL